MLWHLRNNTMDTGYPLSIFKEKPDLSLICSKCQLILKQPVQVTCGHRLCNNCWKQMTGETSPPVCPACEDNGDEQAEVLQAFPDNGIRREMNRMAAQCPSTDCRWSGLFKDFQNHYALCDRQARKQEEVEQQQQQQQQQQRQQQQQQQQAAEQRPMGITSGSHDEFQLINNILAVFLASSMFHVLCYLQFLNNHSRAVVNRRLQSVTVASQLQEDTLESQSGRISALEEAGYGGKLTWKITDIGSRIREAVSGRVKVLRSPDIYTNNQGRTSYKLRASLYPNGSDRNMSLYFEVIEGPMDALMRWPFQAKVTVKFLDQGGQTRVHESFQASFNRPGSNGSVSRYGFNKFLSQSSLLAIDGTRCNVEDSVFIEIKVEDEGAV